MTPEKVRRPKVKTTECCSKSLDCEDDSDSSRSSPENSSCGLVIDFNDGISPSKQSTPATKQTSDALPKRQLRQRKRRRMSMPKDEEELFDEKFEESIQKSAEKNNLTPMCVKKLLKKLVVNDHVLAIVRLKEEEEAMKMNKAKSKTTKNEDDDGEEKEEPQPKLTRLKAKELKKTLFPVASLHQPTPDEEIAALIHEELSSDDDDEEYKPTEDETVSDDDPNTTASDIESQPRTPASVSVAVENDSQLEVQYTKDGLFKIPRARNDSQCSLSEQEQEQENIALRTRSKLCLTTTTIETIESTFIPPDITNDMYDYDCEMDQAWKDFLEEFTKPLPNNLEDDDDNDPEYVAAEGIPLDPEEMKAGKVSKKELNELVLELMEMGATGDETLLEQTLTETINESLNCGQADDRSSMINTPVPTQDSERGNNSQQFAPITQTTFSSQPEMLTHGTAEQPTNSSYLTPQLSASTRQDINMSMYPSSSIESQSSQASNWSILEETLPSSDINTTTPKGYDSSQRTEYGYWMADCPRNPMFFMKYSSLEEASVNSFLSTSHDVSTVNSETLKRYSIKSTIVPVNVELSLTKPGMNDFQFQLLHQQLRMHVQLTAQHFLQTYAHPKHWKMANTFKDMLQELVEIGKMKTNVMPWNLPLAYDCCQAWEQELAVDNSSNQALIQFWRDEIAHTEQARRRINHRIYQGEFHWRIREKIINCRAFMYPSLIPYKTFRCDEQAGIFVKSIAEERVLALWFERALTILNEELKHTARKSVVQKPSIAMLCEYVAKHWCSARSASWLKKFAYSQRNNFDSQGNSIRAMTFFLRNGYAPPTEHILEVFDANNVIPLSHYQRGTLHHNWERYIFSTKRIAKANWSAASVKQEYIVQNDSSQISLPVTNKNGSNVEFVIRVLVPETAEPNEENNHSLLSQRISETQDKTLPNGVAVIKNENAVTVDAFDKSSEANALCEKPMKNAESKVLTVCKVINPDNASKPSGCANPDKCNQLNLQYVQNNGSEQGKNDTGGDAQNQNPPHLTQILSDPCIAVPKLTVSEVSGGIGKRSRAAAIATLYAVLKKYVKVLKVECRKELAGPLLAQPNHPIFRIYTHFKQLEVYGQFLNELRKMSDNFATYRHRYRPPKECYSQRIQDGLLRFSCNQLTDGSLIISAVYITDQFADYHSMEEKDAMFAFNFYEKVEETLLASDRTDLLERFEQILRNFDESEDRVASLYYQIEDLLGESYPQLVDMFLTFLLPGQAAEVGKFFEHFILANMGDFLEKLNIFFAKQPSQIKKIHACLTDLSTEPNVTMDQVKMKVLPLLKGSTLLTEWFLQLFPGERPPESSLGDFEHITMKKYAINENCDAGTVYEHISYTDTTPEGSENACGSSTIRYIQGRIFQGALPARLSFLAKNCVTKNVDQLSQGAIANGGQLCDDETFMAHAIRLNPLVHCPKGISYADVAHLLEDNTNELELVSQPMTSVSNTSIAEEESKAANTSKKVLPKLPIKKRFSSPNTRKAGTSPGDEKNSPGGKDAVSSKKTVTSTAVAVCPDSKALATARKLKTVINAPQSSSSEEQKLDGLVMNSLNNSEHSVPTHGLTKSNDKSDELLEPEPSTETATFAQQVPNWTREEDKIILQDIIKGYSSVDAFVQQLEQKIPERSSEQIRSRFEFLHKMLRQVNQK